MLEKKSEEKGAELTIDEIALRKLFSRIKKKFFFVAFWSLFVCSHCLFLRHILIV